LDVSDADDPVVETTMKSSRAVVRPIEPGNSAMCALCGAQVKFVARAQLRQVIANVYIEDNWARVEHYHADCYGEAGEPYGPAEEKAEKQR
jgi:hypothetical protein